MKKFFCLMMTAVLVFSFVSCNDDDDDPVVIQPPSVSNLITSGAWRITFYQEGDNDETANFAGYNFTFGTDNTLTATNGTNIYTGGWSFEDDDSGSDDFNLFFASPDNFQELTEDWDILESTATKLKLKHTSGGDGSIDYVTFEKNL